MSESALALSTINSFCASNDFIVLICWKCEDMSVARTISITKFRNSLFNRMRNERKMSFQRNKISNDVKEEEETYLYSSLDKFCKMLPSSSSIILNADEIWKFSRTALSLYKIAVSDLYRRRLKIERRTGDGKKRNMEKGERKKELLFF